MRFSVIFCIYEHKNYIYLFFGKNEKNVCNGRKYVLSFLIQIKGWYGVFRIEGTKLNVSFQGQLFWVENLT